MDYRDTINLPFTELAMKAGLAKKEPEILKFWNEINLYGEIRKLRSGKEQFDIYGYRSMSQTLVSEITHSMKKTVNVIKQNF